MQVTPMQFFAAMDGARRGWLRFMPGPQLNKSLFGVLMLIRHSGCKRPEAPGVRISELASAMHQSVPAVSQKITALERQNLVCRIAHPSDRRVCYIALTDQGRELTQQMMQSFERRVEQILQQLGEEKSEQLIGLLHDLADVLEQVDPIQPLFTEEPKGGETL